jgi:hypothetical protein
LAQLVTVLISLLFPIDGNSTSPKDIKTIINVIDSQPAREGAIRFSQVFRVMVTVH